MRAKKMPGRTNLTHSANVGDVCPLRLRPLPAQLEEGLLLSILRGATNPARRTTTTPPGSEWQQTARRNALRTATGHLVPPCQDPTGDALAEGKQTTTFAALPLAAPGAGPFVGRRQTGGPTMFHLISRRVRLALLLALLALPALGCGLPQLAIPAPPDKNVAQHARQGDYGLTYHPATNP